MDESYLENLNYDAFIEVIGHLDVLALRNLYSTSVHFQDWLNTPHVLQKLRKTYGLPETPGTFNEFLEEWYRYAASLEEKEKILDSHLRNFDLRNFNFQTLDKFLSIASFPGGYLDNRATEILNRKDYLRLQAFLPYLSPKWYRENWFYDREMGIMNSAPDDFIVDYLGNYVRATGKLSKNSSTLSKALERPRLFATLTSFFTEEAIAHAAMENGMIRNDLLTTYITDENVPVEDAVVSRRWDQTIALIAYGYPVSGYAVHNLIPWLVQTDELRSDYRSTGRWRRRMDNPRQGEKILRSAPADEVLGGLPKYDDDIVEEVPYLLALLTPRQRKDLFWLDLFSERESRYADILFHYGLVPQNILGEYNVLVIGEDPVMIAEIEAGWGLDPRDIRIPPRLPLRERFHPDRRGRIRLDEADVDDYLTLSEEEWREKINS